MRIAFYAPLKPPTHPVPSGDRRVARLLIAALEGRGHAVELAARLRSYDGAGDLERQTQIAGLAGRLAARLIARIEARPTDERPQLWLTYHLYYKAPDWIGPRVAGRLGLPYVVAEASVAAKRAGGPWSLGHAATLAALRRAAAVISFNPRDDAGVRPHLAPNAALHAMKPFLDAAPYAAAAAARAPQRGALARLHDLPIAEPWLVAVAMMRAGDKLASYALLGEALQKCAMERWRLLVVGDGPARTRVVEALRPLGERVRYFGQLDGEALAAIYAAADLLVWPAVNEAYGMAVLEAQAAGLPAVVGEAGGVAQLVDSGRTGRLVPPRDADAFAAATLALLRDPPARAAMSAAARAKVEAEHGLAAAGRRLDEILGAVVAGAP